MREQLVTLGCKIRELRKKRRMTLQELAERTGLTAGLLSKIENFRTIPSLPVLVEIARALETGLSELFEDIVFSEKKNWLLVHRHEHRPVEREPDHGLHYRMIFETPLDAVSMQVMLVTEGNRRDHNPVSSEADQLLYILSGNFRYRIGDDRIELAEGDLLFFDGAIPHSPEYKPDDKFSLLAFYFLRPAQNRK